MTRPHILTAALLIVLAIVAWARWALTPSVPERTVSASSERAARIQKETGMGGTSQKGVFYSADYVQAADRLDCSKEVLGARDNNGGTMLHRASLLGDLTFAKALLNAGSDVNAVDLAGRTPLHEAILDQNIEMIELLATCGANLEIRDNEGASPMMLAAGRRGGSAAFQKLRLLGGVVDVYSEYLIGDRLALMAQLARGESLIEEVRNIRLKDRWLAYAHRELDEQWMRVLLRAGALVEGDGSVESPLWFACWHKSPISIIRLLLEFGADASRIDPISHMSPIEAAMQSGYSEALDAMREASS